jgi:hypothetical protein
MIIVQAFMALMILILWLMLCVAGAVYSIDHMANAWKPGTRFKSLLYALALAVSASLWMIMPVVLNHFK